jgi:hypothetical protein
VEVTDIFGYYSFLMNYMGALWQQMRRAIRRLMRDQDDAAAGHKKSGALKRTRHV